MTSAESALALALVQTARSFLFVPGDRPERFDKAAAAGADVVIVDLEDAVALDRRAAAREALVAWLTGGGSAAVRLNAVGTQDHELDVAALATLAADEVGTTQQNPRGLLAVVVAKAEDATALTAVAGRLRVPVVALLETAVGVLAAAQIAAANGVARLAFGHLDYAFDLRADSGHTAMLHARSTLVLVSRAAGLPGPVDGVTVALDDLVVLDDDLAHARELGLSGKLLIHPRQVEATHAAYRPSDDDVAWAERVVAVAATGDGQGAIRLDGDMVDPPVLFRAQDILRRKDR